MSSTKSQKQREKTEIQIRLQTAFKGRSLSDIAKLLDQNYSSFWNWTSGRTKVSNIILSRIARLNISTNWILTGEGDPWTVPQTSKEAIARELTASELLSLKFGGGESPSSEMELLAKLLDAEIEKEKRIMSYPERKNKK